MEQRVSDSVATGPGMHFGGCHCGDVRYETAVDPRAASSCNCNVSVNMNTLDDFDPSAAKVVYWDGRHDNWDAGSRPTPWPVSA